LGAGGLGEARLRAAAPRRAVEVARLGAERGFGAGLALVLVVVAGAAAAAVATFDLGPGFARGFAAGLAAVLAGAFAAVARFAVLVFFADVLAGAFLPAAPVALAAAVITEWAALDALAPISSLHLPDSTRWAASATASAMSVPSFDALDITAVAALEALSAASIPASRILRRAVGLAAIAAAAAVNPAASISRLTAAFASRSIVVSPLLLLLPDLLVDLAMVRLRVNVSLTRRFTCETVPSSAQQQGDARATKVKGAATRW